MLSVSERKSVQQSVPHKSGLTTRRRRQPYPFFLHMGPVALCITCVLLIGLMAVLYISQLGQAVAANEELQQIHAEQAELSRQEQDLKLIIAQEQSPSYIAEQAQKMGLVPSDPKKKQIITIHLKPFLKNDQNFQP